MVLYLYYRQLQITAFFHKFFFLAYSIVIEVLLIFLRLLTHEFRLIEWTSLKWNLGKTPKCKPKKYKL